MSMTLTELYQLFTVTTLQKQVKDGDKPTHPVDSEVEKILCDMLKGIPKQVASSGNSVLFKQTRFPCFFLTGIVKKIAFSNSSIHNGVDYCFHWRLKGMVSEVMCLHTNPGKPKRTCHVKSPPFTW